MGLAERKVKQKIGLDPRNLTWSDDKSRFSYQHMKALGWQDDRGLGNGLDGNPNHIAVARKLDNGGIGVGRARKEGDELGGQAGAGLNDVLKRLAASASASPALSPSPIPTPLEAVPEDDPAKRVRNKMASRQRHLQSKRLASQSAAAMAEILGIPVSQLPTPSVSGTASPAPEEKPSIDGEPKREATDLVSTSTVSVSDYFRQKLREKALARQAASGSATPLPELPPAVDVKPSSEWEGSKVKFDETNVKLETLGGYELTAPEEQPVDQKPIISAEDEKAAKQARKAEKAAKKAAKEALKAEQDVSPPAEPCRGEAKALKRAAKEERRREKSDRKRKREE